MISFRLRHEIMQNYMVRKMWVMQWDTVWMMQ